MNRLISTAPLLLFFILALCPTVAPAEAEEVANLRQRFESKLQEEVESPYNKEFDLLRTEYQTALDQERQKATADGKTMISIEFRLEMQSLDSAEVAPSPNPVSPELIRMRGSFQNRKQRLDATRTANLKSLIERFTPEVNRVEIELTKARKIDEALEARNLRSQLQDLALGKITSIEAQIVPAPTFKTSTFPLAIIAESERRDFSGPPIESIADDAFFIGSNSSSGKLHLNFNHEMLEKLSPSKHVVWLRFHTGTHNLAPTDQLVTVYLDGSLIGTHHGAPRNHTFMIPLNVARFPIEKDLELKVECGDNGIIVKTLGSSYPPRLVVDRAGGHLLEGEDLKIATITGGTATPQPTGTFQNRRGSWSGEHQLWWRQSKVGDQLALSFEVPRSGTYGLRFSFGQGTGYGNFRVSIDTEHLLFPKLSLHCGQVLNAGETYNRKVSLEKGTHRLNVQTLAPDKRARPKNNAFGLDYIRLVEAETD